MRPELIKELNIPDDVVILQKKNGSLSPLGLENVPDDEFHYLRSGLDFVLGEKKKGNRQATSDNGFGFGPGDHISYRIVHSDATKASVV